MLGKKPLLADLRVFGCTAYVHVPREKRNKLNACSQQGIFTGYEAHSKAWRVYVWRSGRFISIKSRNVRFMENVRPDSVLSHVEDCEADELIPRMVSTREDAVDIQSEEEDAPLDDEQNHSSEEDDDVPMDTDTDGEDDDEHEPRYPKRNRNPPTQWYKVQQARINATNGLPDNPQSFKEVYSRPDAELWKQAINTEMTALLEKGVYEIVSLPENKRALPSKMVFTIKRDEQGNVNKYKCRMVAKGFRQIAGRDFDEVFAPTAQHATLRILLALAATRDFIIHQVDVKTAFLNGDLDEEVYLKIPQELGGHIWRLKKALYGLSLIHI